MADGIFRPQQSGGDGVFGPAEVAAGGGYTGSFAQVALFGASSSNTAARAASTGGSVFVDEGGHVVYLRTVAALDQEGVVGFGGICFYSNSFGVLSYSQEQVLAFGGSNTYERSGLIEACEQTFGFLDEMTHSLNANPVLPSDIQAIVDAVVPAVVAALNNEVIEPTDPLQHNWKDLKRAIAATLAGDTQGIPKPQGGTISYTAIGNPAKVRVSTLSDGKGARVNTVIDKADS